MKVKAKLSNPKNCEKCGQQLVADYEINIEAIADMATVKMSKRYCTNPNCGWSGIEQVVFVIDSNGRSGFSLLAQWEFDEAPYIES